mmetsp:Transcript_47441/g.125288  ORF Transcript_47441/g.125288 Transcript_47441/m.125288 type:complete len:386 (+) Transcript_47441:158-1315(+)
MRLWCCAKHGMSSGHSSDGKPGLSSSPKPIVSAKALAPLPPSVALDVATRLATAPSVVAPRPLPARSAKEACGSDAKSTGKFLARRCSMATNTWQERRTKFTWSTSEVPSRSTFDTSSTPFWLDFGELGPTLPPPFAWIPSRLHKLLNCDLCEASSGICMATVNVKHVPSFDGQVPRKPRREEWAKPRPERWSSASMLESAWQARLKTAWRSEPFWQDSIKRWSSSLTLALNCLSLLTKIPLASGQSRPNPEDNNTSESGSSIWKPSARSSASSSSVIPPGRGANVSEPEAGKYSPFKPLFNMRPRVMRRSASRRSSSEHAGRKRRPVMFREIFARTSTTRLPEGSICTPTTLLTSMSVTWHTLSASTCACLSEITGSNNSLKTS